MREDFRATGGNKSQMVLRALDLALPCLDLIRHGMTYHASLDGTFTAFSSMFPATNGIRRKLPSIAKRAGFLLRCDLVVLCDALNGREPQVLIMPVDNRHRHAFRAKMRLGILFLPTVSRGWPLPRPVQHRASCRTKGPKGSVCVMHTTASNLLVERITSCMLVEK